MKKQTDWVGIWYKASSERGSNVTPVMARIDLSSGKIENFDFSHAQYDGMGALGTWLRSEGYTIDVLPQAKINDRPKWHEIPGVLKRGMGAAASQNVDWKQKNLTIEEPSSDDYVYKILSVEETDKLNEVATSNGVSQNAWLLSCLNNVLIPELLNEGGSGDWLFPVNMRGNVNKNDDTCNQSSAVFIRAEGVLKPSEIRSQMKQGLVNKIHWSNWWAFHSARLYGYTGVKYFSKRSSEKSYFLGTFTNMGQWPIEGTEPEGITKEEGYLVGPPGSKNYPISMGLITWKGRMGISFKIHPYILKERQKVSEYFEMILKNALVG